MQGFIDRLAELFKTLFGNESDSRETGGRAQAGGPRRPSVDPDYQAAWEELNEYINTGANRRTGSSGPRSSGEKAGLPRPADKSLRRDFANLEVPFGADMEEVRKSYKRLMLKYHPDRHAGDPEKQRIALEIAKKINESFERIRSHHEG